jgi:hypothetical protein
MNETSSAETCHDASPSMVEGPMNVVDAMDGFLKEMAATIPAVLDGLADRPLPGQKVEARIACLALLRRIHDLRGWIEWAMDCPEVLGPRDMPTREVTPFPPDVTADVMLDSVVRPWLKPSYVRLHAGEMSAQEMRSVLAVVQAIEAGIVAVLPATPPSEPRIEEISP